MRPSDGSAAIDIAATAVAGAVAADHPRIMASVIAAVGDWQLAEDAVQDACERALEVWTRVGIPDNPAGWLVTTARRRAIDLIRRAEGRDATAQRYGVAVDRGMLDRDPDPGIDDDRLRLILTCAHPALPMEGRVALTLRTVLGMTPADVGRLFFAGESAMQKRLVRARAKIAEAGIPYRVPAPDELPARVDSALGVIYLLFTSGYSDPDRAGLMPEALRLARLLADLLPTGSAERRETEGLCALMTVQHARTDARYAADGSPVLLDAQDRTRWDRAAIVEADAAVERILQSAAHRREPVGPYVLQAAIALEHALPEHPDATDWARIADLHALLARVAESPAQRIARAVAVGRASGPDHGLALLDATEDADGLHHFHAARADLLERAGRMDDATASYRRASELAPTELERKALELRIARLSSPSGVPPRAG